MEETQESTVPTPDLPPKAPRASDLTGRVLGDFQLLRRIGQGGMGQVYLARQLSLKREVALKILRTDLAANVTSLRRFQAEAEAVARITHANIVQVYAIGETDGLHYMALEYVEGRNLREYLLKKGPPELPIAINILRQVASALQRAHEMGFVHRDIKPENILLTRKGEVKVADFGLSRCFATEQPLNLTQSGVSMGTPLYMSPEQVQGHAVDPRSDIYSFGVTAYHMLAGEPPFRGQSPFEVALQHVQAEPRSLEEFGIPAELAAIIHKMMAKKPEHRYPSAREVLRDLTRFKESFTSTQLLGTPSLSVDQLRRPGESGQVLPVLAESHSHRSPIGHFPKSKVAWFVGTVCVAFSGGVLLHWLTERPPQPPSAGPAGSLLGELELNTDRQREKELVKRLDEKAIKAEQFTELLLELGMLYLKERRFDEAMRLFEMKELLERPSNKELSKLPLIGRDMILLISRLGQGIVLAYRDQPKESLEMFAAVMPKMIAKPKFRPQPRSVDLFLKRFPDWSKAVSDALDRNARNLDGKLDDTFARYRSYARPDR